MKNLLCTCTLITTKGCWSSHCLPKKFVFAVGKPKLPGNLKYAFRFSTVQTAQLKRLYNLENLSNICLGKYLLVPTKSRYCNEIISLKLVFVCGEWFSLKSNENLISRYFPKLKCSKQQRLHWTQSKRHHNVTRRLILIAKCT